MKRELIGIVSAACCIAVLTYGVVFQFSHPELTDTQLVSALWWVILLALGLGFSTWWGFGGDDPGLPKYKRSPKPPAKKITFKFADQSIEVDAPEVSKLTRRKIFTVKSRDWDAAVAHITDADMKFVAFTQVRISTGIQDYTGREILLNDRVEFEYSDRVEVGGKGKCRGEVTFERGCFCVRELGFDYDGRGELPMTLYEWCRDEKVHIIYSNNK